jgi:peptidoglycan LD-endopeptidase CwlK
MPTFSASSQANLAECDQRLQDLFNEVIKSFDCTIICGHRGEEAQHKAFLEGNSKLDWPNGEHNTTPSKAVDVMPCYPDGIRWKDEHGLYFFAGFVKATALKMGILLRWGGDWDGDDDTQDQTFNDPDHFEVK